MKKIEINLYPSVKSASESKYFKYIKKYFPIAFIALAGCIVINIAIFFLQGIFNLPYGQLKVKWEQVSPQVNAINEFKKNIDLLRTRRSEYDELAGHTIEASRFFADIVKALPKNVWIDDVWLSDEGISFIGYAVEWKEDYAVSINSFIKNLQQEEYFTTVYSKIKLKSQEKINWAGREIARFEIECRK